MAKQALALGAGVTVRNTDYDFASQTTSQVGANGHTYLALGSGPTDGMTKTITDNAVISTMLSYEFLQLLYAAGLSVSFMEVYKMPTNYDGYPQCATADADAVAIVEQWGGDGLVTATYDTSGKTATAQGGECQVYVDSGAGTEEANWKHCSELTAVDSITDSTPTVINFRDPVNSTNGSGAVGYAVCVFLNGVFTLAEAQTALADHLA